MRNWILLVIGIALVVVALVGFAVFGRHRWSYQSRPGAAGPGARGPFATVPLREFASNGEQIYYTARSESGDPVTFTGGPHWFRRHGGSCVSCHGPDGRGQMRVPMTDQVAPDIRYSALSSDEHEGGVSQGHPPYTEETLRRAITEGVDPAGRVLNWAMPRWRMSERDMDDLVDYLKALDDH